MCVFVCVCVCVCCRALAGIVGSNPAGDFDVCLLCVLCVVSVVCCQVEVSAKDRSLVESSLTEWVQVQK